MSNVTVITRKQLEAIRAKIQETEHTPQQQDRLHLKKLSDQRAARWPDTLQAQRQRKAKVKEERLAAEEAERVRLDEIEAEERAERRRVQIEAANKMLYEDADKPKAFRSKLLLSDIMQEQAAQREYAAQIKALRRQQDEEFLKQMWAGLKAQEEKELAALRSAKQRALAQRDVQLQQLEALKQRILDEQAADRAEGALIRQRALEEAEQLKQKETAMRERAKRANLETHQANEILQKFKQLEVEREKEAMAAIEAYAAKKAELAEERRRREAEREAAKEARKQRMRDYMEKNLLESKAASDTRLARDIKQAEDKAEADAAEEQRLRQEEMDSIDRSRKRQIEVKKARAKAQEAADKEFAAAWQKRLEQLKAEEVQEAKDRLDINRRYVAFLQHQIDQKAARAAALVAQDHEASQVRDWMLQDEDETFDKYANVCIDEWARQGKTTKPMELHMQKLKRHAKSVTR